MIDIAVIFGADRSNAEYELLESLRFEMELAKVSNKIMILLQKCILLYIQIDFFLKIKFVFSF